MARTYSNKRTSRQTGGAPHQFLVVVVTFLLGYLTASVFDIGTISHWLNTQVLAHSEGRQQQPPAKIAAEQAQLPPKPKFEFYTLLANEKAGGSPQANPNGTHAVAPTTQPVGTAAVVTASHSSIKTPPSNQHPITAKVTEAKTPTSSLVSKGNYLIQVAAFKARSDAEHMKALLILKGYNVNVIAINQAQGNWFRVIVGPYSNKFLAQKAQGSLARNERIKGMIMGAGA